MARAAATLDALLAGREELDEELDARPGLYRILLKIWSSLNLQNPEPEQPGPAQAAATSAR